MSPTLGNERCAVAGYLAPVSSTTETLYTDYVDMRIFKRVQCILTLGVITGAGTNNCKVISYTDGAGAGVLDVAGKAITAIDTTGDRCAVVTCCEDELADGQTHIRFANTTAVAASIVGMMILGMDAREEPASDNDCASVCEIVD